MGFRQRLLLILFLSAGLPVSYSQQPGSYPDSSGYIFRNYDNSSGLISNEVFSITQDAAGFMWIGTRRGLQRYDGVRFVSFPDNRLAPNGTMVTYHLRPDHLKSPVFYNQDSTRIRVRYKGKKDAADIYARQAFNKSNAKPFRENNGAVWLLQDWSSLPARASDQIRTGTAIIKDPAKPLPNFAFMIRDIKQQCYWVYGVDQGLLRFDEQTGQVESPRKGKKQNALFELIAADPLIVHEITLDTRGYLWLPGWADVLYRYDTRTQALKTFSVNNVIRQQSHSRSANGWFGDILEDDHRNLWLATARGGLLRFQYDTEQFSYITSLAGNTHSLQYNIECMALFQDREQHIWVGTDKGVSVFNPYHPGFSALRYDPNPMVTVPEFEISSGTVTAGNKLMMGTLGGGINVYDSNEHYLNRMLFGTKDENLIWSMCTSSDGITWAGCQRGIIHIIGRDQQLIKTLRPPELEGYTVRAVATDEAGDFYSGMHRGRIVKWERAAERFIPFENDQRIEHRTGAVLHIFKDHKTSLWAGCVNGLVEYDAQTYKRVGIYRPDGFAYSPCHGIIRFNDSVLAVGMENAGLRFFNERSRTFVQLPFSDRINKGSVYAVRMDPQKKLWFTTDFGVSEFDPSNGNIISSYPSRGVIRSSFQLPGFMVGTRDKLFTATSTEIIGFDPGIMSRQADRQPALVITGLQVFGTPIFIDSLIADSQPVRLGYDQNFINIEFANLQFGNLTADHYYYRMNGVDRDWVDGGARGSAEYTNLPPGNYLFEVTAGNPATASRRASFSVIIEHPFWTTWWFRTICVLALIAGGAALVRWYTGNIRREADLKQQIAQTEMMALRAQMNPHFIFNCLNSIDAMIQSNNKHDATVYLGKFARLIRNILDSSRQHTIAFSKDIETLRLYIDLERFRMANNFEAEIRIDDTLNNEDIKVPPLIIQPYVENAIQHGLRNRESGLRKLTIDIFRENGKLVYVIEDNGVGRAASAAPGRKHRSYGLELSLERVRSFNQAEDWPVLITDLQRDGKPAGTRVQVTLIIKHA
jgi:ligand-binding sensor domain-containing protein/two-component sensor histidine kinase